MTDKTSLILFLAFVIAAGLAVGWLTAPGEWYAGLDKPSFNPPRWVFAPVWTGLYILIAIAGWRIWRLEYDGPAMVAWWVQLTLNFLWSPIFFVAHDLLLALVVLLAMLAAILTFIVQAWPLDRPAAWLFVPYALWTTFAGVLNASIWWLN
jgi:tryptophan-rich sensory protein